jgi:hypothetical protein
MPLHDHWFDVAPEFPSSTMSAPINGDAGPRRRRTTSMETPALTSSVAWACRSWWMSISTPARFAVGLPAVVGGVVRQRPSGTVAAGPEQRAGGVCPVTAAMASAPGLTWRMSVRGFLWRVLPMISCSGTSASPRWVAALWRRWCRSSPAYFSSRTRHGHSQGERGRCADRCRWRLVDEPVRDIATKLMITKGKKKGRHPSPATVLRMPREHDECAARAQESLPR